MDRGTWGWAGGQRGWSGRVGSRGGGRWAEGGAWVEGAGRRQSEQWD